MRLSGTATEILSPYLMCKVRQAGRLVRRMPVSPFGLEERHTFECVDPDCGHQMEMDGRG